MMEPKVQAIAKRFAEYLVGAMLERSGAEFFRGRAGQAGNADFLVRNGDRFIAIHVRHTTDPADAINVWQKWLDNMAGSAIGRTDDFYEPHLVIVTGAGERVFADDAAARLLVPDNRTTLFMLTNPGAVQKSA
jgi:hypothetical protein